MGKSDFFHRGPNYLFYASKQLKNICDICEKSWTKFSSSNLWSFITSAFPLSMAPYLVHNSIHTPEVQYGPYTALGIVHSWSNEVSKSNSDFTIQFWQILIMSLFRPFTITFWKWEATDALMYAQDTSWEYFCWFAQSKLYYIYAHKTQFPQQWKKIIFSAAKKLILKMGLFF